MNPTQAFVDIRLADSKSGNQTWSSKPKWRLYLGTSDRFSIELDKAPNIIHRFFQRLILGFRYDKQ